MIDAAKVLDLLAAGKMQKQIASELGCSYPHIRATIGKQVKAMGCRTLEQAVAKHVLKRVKEEI